MMSPHETKELANESEQKRIALAVAAEVFHRSVNSSIIAAIKLGLTTAEIVGTLETLKHVVLSEFIAALTPANPNQEN